MVAVGFASYFLGLAWLGVRLEVASIHETTALNLSRVPGTSYTGGVRAWVLDFLLPSYHTQGRKGRSAASAWRHAHAAHLHQKEVLGGAGWLQGPLIPGLLR